MVSSANDSYRKPAQKRRASIPPELLPLYDATFLILNNTGENIGGGRIISLLENKADFEGLDTLQGALSTTLITRLKEKFKYRPGVLESDELFCVMPARSLLRDNEDLSQTIYQGLKGRSEEFAFKAERAQKDTVDISSSSMDLSIIELPVRNSEPPATQDCRSPKNVKELCDGISTDFREDSHEPLEDQPLPSTHGSPAKRSTMKGLYYRLLSMPVDDQDSTYCPSDPSTSSTEMGSSSDDEEAGATAMTARTPNDTIIISEDDDEDAYNDDDEIAEVFSEENDPDMGQFAQDANRLASLKIRTRMDELSLVREFCTFFLIPFEQFSPSANFPIPGIKPRRIKGVEHHARMYQVFTAFWMLYHERSHTLSSQDFGKMSFGGVVAHDPGLGKTLCAIISHVLNLKLVLLDREIRQDRVRAKNGSEHKHLPRDAPAGSVCHHGRNEFGFQCLCEPNSVARSLNFSNGATIVAVKRTLVRVWINEWRISEDREYLNALIARQHNASGHPQELRPKMMIFNGHPQTRVPDIWSDEKFFSPRNSAPYLKRPYTRDDWQQANQQQTWPSEKIDRYLRAADRSVLTRILSRRTFKDGDVVIHTPATTHPEQFQPLAAAVTGFTSYICLSKRILPRKVALMPADARYHPCVDKENCILRSKNCRSASHKYNVPSLEVHPLSIARLVVDEAHNIKSESTEFLKTLGSLVKSGLNHHGLGPSLWLLTGTPWSRSPFDLQNYYLQQLAHPKEQGWGQIQSHHPRIAKIVKEQLQAAEHNWEAMRRLRDLKLIGNEDATSPRLREKAARIEQTYHEETTKTSDLLLDFMIKVRPSDTFKGQPILDLPPRIDQTVYVAASAEQDKQLRRLLSDVREDESHDQDTSPGKSSRSHGKSPQKRRSAATALSNALSFLSLNAIEETPCPAASRVKPDARCNLSENINAANLWELEIDNPFFTRRAELLEGSPKTQELVRIYKQMDSVDIPDANARNSGDHTASTTKGRPQLLVAVKKPSRACALLHALRLALEGELEKDQIVVFHSGLSDDKQNDIITRFQQQADPDDDIKILVLNTRVGGEGLTLTRANRVFHFDIEHRMEAYEQTSCRVWRMGREEEVENTQLAMEFDGIEKTILDKRERSAKQLLEILERRRGGAEHMDTACGPKSGGDL